MPNKLVWDHVDMLLDTGEPKGDKEDMVGATHLGLHVTAYFDSACHKKKDAGRFMVYGCKG